MFKKLREKLYDKKTKKYLENMQFDTFSYCGDSTFPAFIVESCKGNREIHSAFVPQTENSFKMAFEKLKKRYFKKVPYSVMKENVKTYCMYFYFSDETLNYCVEVFNTRKAQSTKNKANKINNNHIDN